MQAEKTSDRGQGMTIAALTQGAAEHRRNPAGMSAEVLRAANRVLENYAASLRRHKVQPASAP